MTHIRLEGWYNLFLIYLGPIDAFEPRMRLDVIDPATTRLISETLVGISLKELGLAGLMDYLVPSGPLACPL
jgi:hypothetical protein